MTYLDLAFPVTSTSAIAVDHGYHLYAGLSKVLDAIHSAEDIAVHPIRGRQIGNRMLQLMPWSTVCLRLPQERIGDVISLSGQSVSIGEHHVRLGVPSVKALGSASALRSRLVTIKGFMETDEFAAAVRRQLNELDVGDQCIITVGKRRTLRIKDKEVVGFEVIFEGLLESESITVQENRLGGRSKMGCGVFVRFNAYSTEQTDGT